jgi:hypothetical protein
MGRQQIGADGKRGNAFQITNALKKEAGKEDEHGTPTCVCCEPAPNPASVV